MAAFYLADFQRVTDDAFSFLSRRYGYTPCPVERGGLWGTGLLRRFVRGPYEIGVCFGDADAHYLCTVSFRVHVGQDSTQHANRSLSELLAKRQPAFVHPTRPDLSADTTPESIVQQYGKLVEQYAIDVVEGDFAAFSES